MLDTEFGPDSTARSNQLFARLDTIARQTGLVVRRSPRFSATGFVLALLKAVLTGKASFNQLAIALGQSEAKALSRQAAWKRVGVSALRFMIRVVARAIKDRWAGRQLVACARFRRVIIEDSSQAKLPAANHPDFPGHGNDKGATAGCKFDLAFDLLSGEVLSSSLHLATDQDRQIGKDVVDLVRADDLVLRDMGYFSLGEFGLIERRGAFWLSRLPVNVTACDHRGVSLEERLRKTKANRIEFEVYLGEDHHPARLLAVRAEEGVAEQRRRQRKLKARDLGKTSCRNALTRDAWHIIITNVDSSLMGADALFKLYSVRWQIEITFRAWKQSAHLVKALARRSNPFHLQVLMYAAILLLILTMKIAALLQATHSEQNLSIEKLAHHFALFILSLSSLRALDAYHPDLRHLQMDRRARESLRGIASGALG
jgi:hypothetical protein